ncbi:hypothetical protein A0256_02885 [Mucilaginibacter sp. PAMC 26640]|nr:hypothetical protein A0256_02885 [Mucilaginibacter sp. PAMC 26640]
MAVMYRLIVFPKKAVKFLYRCSNSQTIIMLTILKSFFNRKFKSGSLLYHFAGSGQINKRYALQEGELICWSLNLKMGPAQHTRNPYGTIIKQRTLHC